MASDYFSASILKLLFCLIFSYLMGHLFFNSFLWNWTEVMSVHFSVSFMVIINSFLYLVFFHKLTIHESVGEGRGHLYSFLPSPLAQRHVDNYLQLYIREDYHIFLIAAHLITRLLFYKYCPPLESAFDWMLSAF